MALFFALYVIPFYYCHPHSQLCFYITLLNVLDVLVVLLPQVVSEALRHSMTAWHACQWWQWHCRSTVTFLSMSIGQLRTGSCVT